MIFNNFKNIIKANSLFVVVLAVLGMFFVSSADYAEANASVEKIKRANAAKINALKRKERYEVNKLYKSQIRLEQARKDLGSSKNRLSSTKIRLNKIQRDLNTTLRSFSSAERMASKRLNNIFRGSYLSILHLFFESENVNEVLDNVYFQQKLIEKDRVVISDMQAKAKRLSGLKYRKEKEKKTLVYTINRINKRKRQVSRSIQVSENMIHKLRTDRATYEKAQEELASQSANISKYLKKNKSSKAYATSSRFIKPIPGRISSYFGWRRHPIFKSRKFHSGVDIAGRNRGNIAASNSGKVIYSGWYGGYGKVVILDHGIVKGKHITTLYAHMYTTKVKKGEIVRQGQVVGLEGSTGYSTGPHLHFEVRIDGKPTNPLSYIR